MQTELKPMPRTGFDSVIEARQVEICWCLIREKKGLIVEGDSCDELLNALKVYYRNDPNTDLDSLTVGLASHANKVYESIPVIRRDVTALYKQLEALDTPRKLELVGNGEGN